MRAIGACLALPAACPEEASDERTLEKRRVMRGLSGAERVSEGCADSAHRPVLMVLCSSVVQGARRWILLSGPVALPHSHSDPSLAYTIAH